MKKFLLVLLSCVMIVAMAGCSPKESAPENENATGDAAAGGLKDFTIACPMPNAGLPMMEVMGKNLDEISALAGGKIMYASSMDGVSSTDGTLSFIEGSIAAGANGIVIAPPADSVLPTVIQLCEDAGVYWGMTMRSIGDSEIRELVEASPYFIGGIYEEEEFAGYEAGKKFNELGYKKIAIISTPKGNMAGDLREEGLQRACDEFGMEIVGEVRGNTQASEAAEAASSLMAANADLDVIFQVASYATGALDAIAKTIADSGSGVRFAAVDFPMDTDAFYATGVVDFCVKAGGKGDIVYDLYMVVAKVINAIQGTPIVDDEGNSGTMNTLKPYIVTDEEEAKKLALTTNDSEFRYYSEDFIQSNLFGWNNADLNAMQFQEFLDSYDPIAISPYYQ
jgi:ABC-type sugar transport system substrate-binding protein